MGKRKARRRAGKTITIPAEHDLLLRLLKEALAGGGQEKEETETEQAGSSVSDGDWSLLVSEARRHNVLSLLYDVLAAGTAAPETIVRAVTAEARKTVLQSYRLLFLSRYLTDRLARAGVGTVCLKGVTAAACYPVPELRKSGDVDLLLLEPEKLKTACAVLRRCGCTVQKRLTSPHDVAFLTEDNIEVELHVMPAGPFDNRQINGYLKQLLSDCRNQAVWVEVMGLEIRALPPAYHGYQMLLHMLQHFLRAGFGLKYLCDWTMFWKQEQTEETKKRYLKLVKDSRLKGFSDTVTMACCQYLGLPRRAVEWMELSCSKNAPQALLSDILEGGEFGRDLPDRMVLPRGRGPGDYIREFHNQMRWNFPVQSRHVLCWPVLWCVTLFRFLRNNRKIRGISTGVILKKAGQRSHLAGKMGLWK